MRSSFSLFAAALFARISLAERDLIFPVVHMGDAGADDDEFADFHAQVMHVNGDVTTYSVGCATEPCAGWANLPDFTYTMAIGPSTVDFVYTDGPQGVGVLEHSEGDIESFGWDGGGEYDDGGGGEVYEWECK
ncbi:hypothetical protein GRF29_164g806539 [Pseudopithomyces chartarum]|uniref:Uncharacterized protein n=1 Tax=Pseudopithomyces chartarum TaxID=1892770 RepID=A0AAN6LTD8_9PLEO|nr:hypothetical protein GRF29_164g806539 [Pseudopithomyces chartarum]